MVRVGVILKDVYNLNYENIGKLFASCLEIHIDDFKQSNDGQLDIILEGNILSSLHLDDILGRLYNDIREYLILQKLDLLPINIFLGNFNKAMIHWDFLYVLSEDTLKDGNCFDYGTSKIIVNAQDWFVTRKECERSGIATPTQDHNKYKVTALGGTFDHLHDGHKILLTLAAFLTSDRLIIGLAHEALLVNKKYQDNLQSFDARRENVLNFLNTFKPTLKIEIVPLKDVCGPTGTVPEIECLVISRETVKGGEMVNETRKERGLSELEIYIVNVLGGKESDGWKEKISSTDIRKLISERAQYLPK